MNPGVGLWGRLKHTECICVLHVILFWGREFIGELIQKCEKALEEPVFQFVDHITPITVWTYVKISFFTAKGKQERDYETETDNLF